MTEFLMLSLVPMLVAALAACACALPGNFLILRRQAMLGDMMAHAVLPGLVTAFLITGRVEGAAVYAGAVGAALLAAGMTETITRLARLDPGAAMGITFTTLFAAGVVLLETTGASEVHLDVEHALYGNLESLVWLEAAAGPGALTDPAAWAGLPPELPRMALILAGLALALALFRRPLVMASFDPIHAAVAGLPVRLISTGLMVATALAAVAAFAAVGSILTIAMLIVPAATARLLTDRLPRQIGLSLLLAILAGAGGVVLGGYGPLWLGLGFSVSASGMIAVLAGGMLALAAIRQGRSTPSPARPLPKTGPAPYKPPMS
ncbi:metal ABC transporter permease [Szabonella alba]|uniref:Metal ABC transporter permease n=1 Tax=Szabonella alba TaxID=2804194 RepID=A0A8K0XZ15_9RHOB|nr:metal ABC transporter permease [Szabonella alba]MBL4916321.1 metal ABC transporter permease [Szabonella alba]